MLQLVFPSEAIIYYDGKSCLTPSVCNQGAIPLKLPEFSIPVSYFTESLMPSINCLTNGDLLPEKKPQVNTIFPF